MGCWWILLLFFSTLSLIKCNHCSMCYWFCNCFLNGLGPKTAALARMSFGLYIWANGWCIFLLGKASNISVKDDLSQKAWLAKLCKVTWQSFFICTSLVEFISDAFVFHCTEVRPKVWMLSVYFLQLWHLSTWLWCFKNWLIMSGWRPKQANFFWVFTEHHLMCVSRQAGKAPVYKGSKWGGWIKEGDTAWELCKDVHTELPSVWRKSVFARIRKDLGYLVWLLAQHHFRQP